LVAEIGRGFLLLVGVGAGDPSGEEERLARKISTLRVFADDDGKMNLALADVAGEALVVSQFTLYGDIRKGRRPSWTGAEDPAIAAARVEAFARSLEETGTPVKRGIFGADMQVDLENDGPVTLVIDAADLP
jgi:D-tyrosyl-tRNA(Tyr) deacylase